MSAGRRKFGLREWDSRGGDGRAGYFPERPYFGHAVGTSTLLLQASHLRGRVREPNLNRPRVYLAGPASDVASDISGLL